MSRSLKKGPYVDENLLKKIKNASKDDKKTIVTWARASVISPEMVGYTIGIHNGKTHVPVFITEEMVGHRLGEFSKTRKFVKHGGRMAKEQEFEGSQSSRPAPGVETTAGADTKTETVKE